MSDSRQLCTFFLSDLYFGVDVQKVQEVIRFQEMTRIPLAPPVIRGLINLRGQIVTAIDMRRRLNLPDLEAERLPMNVVIRTESGPFSLLVDEIGDVLEVRNDECEQPPGNLRGIVRELILCTYKLKDRLLLNLDCDRAIDLNSYSKN